MPAMQIKTKGRINSMGRVEWIDEELPQKQGGWPVNLIVGQTGTGKTSLIEMLVGGLPTAVGTCSDTKHCSVYKITHETSGEFYLLLDTVGLLDSASTNEQRKRFISDLVSYIKKHDLNVCRAFITAPRDGKQMTDTISWYATLMSALGGQQKVSLITHWVLTKWNQGSRLEKQLCEQDLNNPSGAYHTLCKGGNGYEVIKHGDEYQEELFSNLIKMSSTRSGLSKTSMSVEVEHHTNIVKTVTGLKSTIEDVDGKLKNMKKDEDFQREREALHVQIKQAQVDLSNCGKSKARKRQYQNLIFEGLAKLKDVDVNMKKCGQDMAQKKKILQEFNAKFNEKIKELEETEDFMQKFGEVVGATAENVVSVLGLASKGLKRLRTS